MGQHILAPLVNWLPPKLTFTRCCCLESPAVPLLGFFIDDNKYLRIILFLVVGGRGSGRERCFPSSICSFGSFCSLSLTCLALNKKTHAISKMKGTTIPGVLLLILKQILLIFDLYEKYILGFGNDHLCAYSPSTLSLNTYSL